MSEAVIVSAVRAPIAKKGGLPSLKFYRKTELQESMKEPPIFKAIIIAAQ